MLALHAVDCALQLGCAADRIKRGRTRVLIAGDIISDFPVCANPAGVGFDLRA